MSKTVLLLISLWAVANCFTIQGNEATAIALIVADPIDCVKEKCPNEYAKCEQDPKCVPALEDCQKKCGTGKTCWEFCLTKESDSAATNVAKCAANNKCLNAVEPAKQKASTALATVDPQQCIEEKCASQWDTCKQDPKCIPALQDCEKECQDRRDCWHNCLARKGDENARAVAICAADNGCINPRMKSTAIAIVADPIDCVKEKCPNEYAKCEQDPKCVPALEDCQKKCGTGKTCWEFCLTKESDSAATNVAKCAASNKCLNAVEPAKPLLHPFEECVAASCDIAFSECLGDEMCRFYLRKCRIPSGMWNFDFDCLVEKSAFSYKLRNFFDCTGHHKCI